MPWILCLSLATSGICLLLLLHLAWPEWWNFKKQSRLVVIHKNCSPKLIHIIKILFFQKDSYDFWHWKMVLKVRFRHYLTTQIISGRCLFHLLSILLDKVKFVSYFLPTLHCTLQIRAIARFFSKKQHGLKMKVLT